MPRGPLRPILVPGFAYSSCARSNNVAVFAAVIYSIPGGLCTMEATTFAHDVRTTECAIRVSPTRFSRNNSCDMNSRGGRQDGSGLYRYRPGLTAKVAPKMRRFSLMSVPSVKPGNLTHSSKWTISIAQPAPRTTGEANVRGRREGPAERVISSWKILNRRAQGSESAPLVTVLS